MKTVFSNDMCAHVWAQLKQPHGRSGSMRFDGSVAYSYAEPVANIIKPFGRSKPVALFTSRQWSVTTSAHVRDYQRAASQYAQFTVPDLFVYNAREIRDEQASAETHKANLEHFRSVYKGAVVELMRCPADSYRLRDMDDERTEYERVKGAAQTAAHATLRGCADTLNDYCAAFGIVCELIDWRKDAAAAIARRDKILNDPKRAAKLEKTKAARTEYERKIREKYGLSESASSWQVKRAIQDEKNAVARAARAAENFVLVAQWLAGEDVRLPYDANLAADRSAMLRVRGDKVETSLGAEAPLADVRRVLEVVYSRIERGQTWQRDTRYSDDRQETYSKLGHFRLDSIDASGNVRAGCHFITAREIAALITQLGSK